MPSAESEGGVQAAYSLQCLKQLVQYSRQSNSRHVRVFQLVFAVHVHNPAKPSQ